MEPAQGRYPDAIVPSPLFVGYQWMGTCAHPSPNIHAATHFLLFCTCGSFSVGSGVGTFDLRFLAFPPSISIADNEELSF